MKDLCFSKALITLKVGRRVRRAGWNGKGMWLQVVKGVPVHMVDPITFDTPTPSGEMMRIPAARQVEYPPHIAMLTAQGDLVPWLASVTDLMAEDWEIVDGNEHAR